MYEYNGLKILCDWCAFTINTTSIYDFLEWFGFSATDFKVMPSGAYGYKHMLRHKEEEITVLYEGNSNMGVHCEVKGSGMNAFFEAFKNTFLVATPFGTSAYEVVNFDDLENLVPLVFGRIIEKGWFTRLDVAIDDYGNSFFTCAEVESLLSQRLYVAKFRKWDSYIARNPQSEIVGYTIYCGSRTSSDMFLRIYDKRLEQLQKIDGANNPEWVRWEFVLKNEHADNFANIVSTSKNYALSAVALLNGYMRFIVRNDSNISRCSTLPKWLEFVATIEKLRISAPKKTKSVLRSYSWYEEQCAPTIAGLVVANGGSCDFIMDSIKKNYARLKQCDRDMYEKYCEDIEREMCEDELYNE